MDNTIRTISFLRTLSSDGYLSGEEVWSLGKFFQANPACAETWPGNVLEPMLESAFDDGTLSEEEMTALAQTIASIEEEWRMKHPRPVDAGQEEIPVTLEPALIPVIDAKFEVPARDGDNFVVSLSEHSCTCPKCHPRQALPKGHPGKCCKHVVHGFTRTGKIFEPWFQALLDDCFAHARGTNPARDWILLRSGSEKPSVVGGSSGGPCDVFAPTDSGYERYIFNAQQKRWSYDIAPAHSRVIERVIRENFATL